MNITQRRYRLNPIDDTFLSPVEIELELEFRNEPGLGVGVRFGYRASEQPYAGKRDFSTSGFLYPITGSLCELYDVPEGCYHLRIDGYAAPSRHLGTGTSSFVWRWLFDALPNSVRDRLYLSGKWCRAMLVTKILTTGFENAGYGVALWGRICRQTSGTRC